MLTLLQIAARNLWLRRRRTAILGAAIAASTALLVLLLALTAGARQMMLRSATAIQTGHVNVGGFFKVSPGQSIALVTQYQKISELIRAETPELLYLGSRGLGWGLVVNGDKSIKLDLFGVDATELPELSRVLPMRDGTLARLTSPRGIVIFEHHARQLGVRLGDKVTVAVTTFRGTANANDLEIVGIGRDMGLLSQFSVILSNATIRDFLQVNPDTTGVLQLYLKDIASVPAVEARLRLKLRAAGYRVMDPDPRIRWMKFDTINQEGWIGQKLDVSNWEDEMSLLKFALGAFQAAGGLLVFIILVFIGTGTMNSLWISVRERTREIGALRAIGMQSRQVVALMMMESLLLSALSTLLGAMLGALLCLGLNAAEITMPDGAQMVLLSDQFHFAVQPGVLLAASAVITLALSLFSIIPATLAARLRPVIALGHHD